MSSSECMQSEAIDGLVGSNGEGNGAGWAYSGGGGMAFGCIDVNLAGDGGGNGSRGDCIDGETAAKYDDIGGGGREDSGSG